MPHCPACGKLTAQTAAACEHCGTFVPRAAINSPALADRIRRLLADGREVEAIRELRDETGVSLADAKTMVRAVEQDDATQVGVPIASLKSHDQSQQNLDQKLLRLLKEKGKIESVKLCREQTGRGLKEAKVYVERLAERHGVKPTKSGCFGIVLGLLVGFVMATTCVVRAFGADVNSAATESISAGTKSPEGWIAHVVESEYQARPTEIRVLLPDTLVVNGKRDATKPHRVLYVLPVEAAREEKYGDGLTEVKRCDLHNKHGLICVAPTFAHLPWYADHPTDKTIRQESYFVKVVVPFIDRTYQHRRMDASSVRSQDDSDGRGVQPTQVAKESRWLLGFSKSGWGAWSLLARHPELFDRAAAWDAPLDMPRFDLYGAAQVFGTQEHFEQYRVLPAILNNSAFKAAQPRLVLTGYDNFRSQHETAHRLLDEAKVPHIYRDGPKLKHVWNSGWVEEAVELLMNPDRPARSSSQK